MHFEFLRFSYKRVAECYAIAFSSQATLLLTQLASSDCYCICWHNIHFYQSLSQSYSTKRSDCNIHPLHSRTGGWDLDGCTGGWDGCTGGWDGCAGGWDGCTGGWGGCTGGCTSPRSGLVQTCWLSSTLRYWAESGFLPKRNQSVRPIHGSGKGPLQIMIQLTVAKQNKYLEWSFAWMKMGEGGWSWRWIVGMTFLWCLESVW